MLQLRVHKPFNQKILHVATKTEDSWAAMRLGTVKYINNKYIKKINILKKRNTENWRALQWEASLKMQIN